MVFSCPCNPTTPFTDPVPRFLDAITASDPSLGELGVSFSGTPPTGWEQPGFDDSAWPFTTRVLSTLCGSGLFMGWSGEPPASGSEVVSIRKVGGFAIPSTFGYCVCYQLTSLRITAKVVGTLLGVWLDGVSVGMGSPSACAEGATYDQPTVDLDIVNTRAPEVLTFPAGVRRKPSNTHVLAIQGQASSALDAGLLWTVEGAGVYCDYICPKQRGYGGWEQ